MLLEEGIFPVHVRTVEQSSAIDNLIFIGVIVLLVLDIVLLSANVAFRHLSVLVLVLINISVFGRDLLLSTLLVIKVGKDVCA